MKMQSDDPPKNNNTESDNDRVFVSVDAAATSGEKKARKRLKDAEHDLRRELQRYRDARKKIRHDRGSIPGSSDREKIKKAEWMHTSVKHYLKELDKKHPADAIILSDAFHAAIAQSIEDLKRARRAFKSPDPADE